MLKKNNTNANKLKTQFDELSSSQTASWIKGNRKNKSQVKTDNLKFQEIQLIGNMFFFKSLIVVVVY